MRRSEAKCFWETTASSETGRGKEGSVPRIECEDDLVFFSIAVIKHLQKATEGKRLAWLTLLGHDPP